MRFKVFTHSSIQVEFIYIDPFKLKDPKDKASIILITHDHFDHFSPEDIAKIGSRETTVLVVPETMAVKAEEARQYVKTIETVRPGMSYKICDIDIETVPAYNIGKPFHPKENGFVGYVMDTGAGRVYVAGDTDVTPEALNVRCDMAFVPVGGTYTMDASEAARLVNSIKPRFAIPTHYGSVVGSEDDGKTFESLVDDNITVCLAKQY